MPMLADVLFLCLFIFFTFGILGVQLFKGALRGRCFGIDDGALVSEVLELCWYWC